MLLNLVPKIYPLPGNEVDVAWHIHLALCSSELLLIFQRKAFMDAPGDMVILKMSFISQCIRIHMETPAISTARY